jgi:hypothetical protein
MRYKNILEGNGPFECAVGRYTILPEDFVVNAQFLST